MGADELAHPDPHTGVVEITPLVRRVVAARVRDRQVVDDVVQETLTRVMAARTRLEDRAIAPYAIVVARNLVTRLGTQDDRTQRHAHRLVDMGDVEPPEREILKREESEALTAALAELPEPDRETLLAHEVEGEGTASLARSSGTTAGAVAAQLNRTRAKLRVGYLLAYEGVDPPTDRCRPVLLALSAGDRRRQRELDAAGHLLECDCCATLSEPLLSRRRGSGADGETVIAIQSDSDVVAARQQVRAIANQLHFPLTDLALTATAVSEIARNIVRFAGRGQMVVSVVEEDTRRGVTIVARDAGPGIPDVQQALQDGYSTYNGMGLGLSGSRRLMDEFEIRSEVAKGTTVTMTKWRP